MARVSQLDEPLGVPADEGIETLAPGSALFRALPSPVPSPQTGPADGPSLLERARSYLENARAENTRRAYQSDWRAWERWSREHGAQALPATPQALALYLADLATVAKASTLKRRLASLAVIHRTAGLPSPCSAPEVREMLAGILRKHGSATRQARPVLVADLRAMLAELDHSPGLRRDRNRSLLLLGWSAALRESEVSALDLDDVREVAQGLEITLRRSKTDKEGKGHVIPIGFGSRAETCPVRAWTAWRDARSEIATEDPPSAAFPRLHEHRSGPRLGERLSPRAVEDLIRTVTRRAGLGEGFSGHSLRAGFATEAAARGIADRTIMQTTGHRSRSTLDRYVRAGQLWDDCPTARLL